MSRARTLSKVGGELLAVNADSPLVINGSGEIDARNSMSITTVGASAASGKTLTANAIAAGTTVEATSGPSGSAFGFRNKIINGGMQVNQRGNGISFTGAATYSVDRFYSYQTGMSGVTGTMQQNANWNESTITGCAFWSSVSASTGTGKVTQGTRIEAKNTVNLAGKTITITVKVYHDIGSTQNFTIQLAKANTADDFTSVTVLGTITGDIPTGTWTYLTGQITLGATDARNGLRVDLFNTTYLAWSGKGLQTSEWQLEAGSTATPFESRPYGTELALCQRYYHRLGNGASSVCCSNVTNSTARAIFPFPVPMRVAPSVIEQSGTASHYTTFFANTGTSCTSVPTFVTLDTSVSAGGVDATTTSGHTAGQGGVFRIQNASGYLGWSAEL